ELGDGAAREPVRVQPRRLLALGDRVRRRELVRPESGLAREELAERARRPEPLGRGVEDGRALLAPERERERELILERARRRVLEAPLDADREARFFGRRALALAPPRLLEAPRAERRRALARDPEDAAADL